MLRAATTVPSSATGSLNVMHMISLLHSLSRIGAGGPGVLVRVLVAGLSPGGDRVGVGGRAPEPGQQDEGDDPDDEGQPAGDEEHHG